MRTEVPDFGVLLSVPTESVAVRAAVGSLVAMLVVTLLLRSGLRVPRVRSSAVLVPVGALVALVAVSWEQLLLPTLMTSTQAEGAVHLPVGDTYLPTAPVGWPLAAAWLAIASVRVKRRWRSIRRMRRIAAAGAPPRDARVLQVAHGVAARLRVPAPRVVVVDGCPGGAIVLGVRQVTVVIDTRLLAVLDDEELEGLLAHELAHVCRRDNLVGAAVGLVRDVCFFVPGGRWVARRLCAERELAADQVAVGVTARPGALASGLLKAIDQHRPAGPCATFAAPAAVVARVERLVGEAARITGPRHAVESALVAGVLTLAVAVGVQLPALVTGRTAAGDALALAWAWRSPRPELATVEAQAFASFRRSGRPVEVAEGEADTTEPGQEFHPAVLRGQVVPERAWQPEGSDVPLARRANAAVLQQWRATPVVTARRGVGVFWLRRLEAAGRPAAG
ncbi:MAG TPA: M48 family metalloprotease [Nitriliruptorales bacterium]|nr:M48 family metalloprotease [Nitriliruptorales bacterium]